MANTPALMFVATDVDPQHEADWNRWYDTRHVPQRQEIPGFLSARRFELAPGAAPMAGAPAPQRYVALYDLEGPETLETEAYLSLSREPAQSEEDRRMLTHFRNRLRGIMTLILDTPAPGGAPRRDPGALLVVGLEPEAAYEEEFNAWYDEEHVPFLTGVPGVLGVRRFKALREDVPYLAVWELANPEVRRTEAWQRAAGTPWTRRIIGHCGWKISGDYLPRVPAKTPEATAIA